MFDPNNWLWRNVARVGDLIGLSVCWVFCCLPLFTAGAATAALYDAVVHCVRGEETGTFIRYFRSLRGNFKPSVPTTLVFLAVEVLILWACVVTYLMAAAGSKMAEMLVYADMFFLCIPLAVWLMAMTTVSRFTFRGKELLITALQLTIRHLPTAALVTAVVVVTGLLIRILVVPVALLPGVAALVISLPLERLFRKYEKQQTTTPEDE